MGTKVLFSQILLLEDDGRLRTTLQGVLKEYCENLISAENIRAAKKALAQHKPDLIVADYQLPDGTLIELAPHIDKKTDVVAISALATAEESFYLAKLGVHQFLSKPFGLESLEQSLEQVYAKRVGTVPIFIRTFGDFRIEDRGTQLTFNKKPPYKLLAMIKAIIALGGRSVSVFTLCDWLWPDSEGDAAVSKFNTSLHRVRKLIGPSALIQKENTLSFNNSIVDTDVWQLETRLSQGNFTDSFADFPLPWLPGDDSPCDIPRFC